MLVAEIRSGPRAATAPIVVAVAVAARGPAPANVLKGN